MVTSFLEDEADNELRHRAHANQSFQDFTFFAIKMTDFVVFTSKNLQEIVIFVSL